MTLKQIKDFNTKIDNHLYNQGIITEGFYLKQAEKLVYKVNKIIQSTPNTNDDTPVKNK